MSSWEQKPLGISQNEQRCSRSVTASLWQPAPREPSCALGGCSTRRDTASPPHPQPGRFGTAGESIKNKV